MEGSESAVFTQFFKEWRKSEEVVGFGEVYLKHKIAARKKVKQLNTYFLY